MTDHWGTALDALRAQGEAARAAIARLETLREDVTGERALDRLHVASVISDRVGADYIRAATAVLEAHLEGRRPPSRLPAARVWPRPARHLWLERSTARRGGLWTAVPTSQLFARLQAAGPDPLLDQVLDSASALRDSEEGHRRHPRMYEKYDPKTGRPSPTLRGFPDPGHPVNLNFAGGTGVRIQPERADEAARLHADQAAARDRAVAYGDAVQRLLDHHHGSETRHVAPDRTGARRGAARWIGREDALVPARSPWPSRMTPPQIAVLGALGTLVTITAGIPLTIAMHAAAFDRLAWVMLAAILVGGLGAAAVYRGAPRLLRAPGNGTWLIAAAAAAAAFTVGSYQGPVAGHFFADPDERYARQYSDSCLAASPYRLDRTQITFEGTTMLVWPIDGGTTLRLGPAEKGGLQPLRPLDDATRDVLGEWGCRPS